MTILLCNLIILIPCMATSSVSMTSVLCNFPGFATFKYNFYTIKAGKIFWWYSISW